MECETKCFIDHEYLFNKFPSIFRDGFPDLVKNNFILKKDEDLEIIDGLIERDIIKMISKKDKYYEYILMKAYNEKSYLLSNEITCDNISKFSCPDLDKDWVKKHVLKFFFEIDDFQISK